VRVRADHVDRLLGRRRLLLADLFVQHAAEGSAEIRKLAIDATQADAFLLPQHLAPNSASTASRSGRTKR
jgi:hypothetical protein